MSPREEGLGKLAADLVGKRRDIPRLLPSTLKNREFIGAEAGQRILAASRCTDAFCNLAKDGVAGRNAHRIVDGFEAVEVQVHERDLLVWRALGKGGIDLLAKTDAVRQAGQRIVMREVGDPLGGLPLFGDV